MICSERLTATDLVHRTLKGERDGSLERSWKPLDGRAGCRHTEILLRRRIRIWGNIESHQHLIFSGSVLSVGPCIGVWLDRRGGNVASDRHMEVGCVETRNLDLGEFSQVVRWDPVVGVGSA